MTACLICTLAQANVLIMLKSHSWRIIDLGIAARIGALSQRNFETLASPFVTLRVEWR